MCTYLTIGAFLVTALLLAAPVASLTTADESLRREKDPGLRFDATITLGNLLTAIAFLVGIIGAYAAFKARLATLELKVETLWKAWLKEHNRNDES